jgi:hypothetical protein
MAAARARIEDDPDDAEGIAPVAAGIARVLAVRSQRGEARDAAPRRAVVGAAPQAVAAAPMRYPMLRPGMFPPDLKGRWAIFQVRPRSRDLRTAPLLGSHAFVYVPAST